MATVTIPDSERRATYSPTVATTGFAVGFPIFNDDDVTVYLDGIVETGWTMEATYSGGVSTDAVVRADGDGWVDVTVTIVGSYRPRRTDQFSDGAGVPARTLNLIMNRLIATGRETYDRVSRAIVAPWGQTLLPLPTLVAGKALVVNDDGDGFEMGPDADDISAAEANATAASASAAAAAALLDGVASTTSLAIGTGSKAFTVASGLPLAAGMFVVAASDADVTNYMHGQITAYSGTTLTVSVGTVGGSGTLADWTIRLSGAKGPSGAGTGDLLSTNNLDDLDDIPTARTNMGLDAMATKADVSFSDVNSGAVASQADAEAGSATNKLMTPQRTAQAIAALVAAPTEPAIVLISSQVANGDAAIDFTGLDDTYDHYFIEFEGVQPATNGANFGFQIGTGATPTYVTSGYFYAGAGGVSSASSSVYVNSASSGASMLFAPDVRNGARFGASGRISFGGVDDSARDPVFVYQVAWSASSGALAVQNGSGKYNGATAFTAIRFLMSSGNISAGRFSLYGRKTS